MKKVKAYVMTAAAATMLMPMLVLAQSGPQSNFGYFGNFLATGNSVINNILVPLVFALALLAFLWGALQYFIWGGHNEDNRKEGRMLMLYAVLGFVLMVSIFGIVNVVTNSLNLQQQDLNDIPRIEAGSSGSRTYSEPFRGPR